MLRKPGLLLLRTVAVVGLLIMPASPAASASDKLPDLAMARLRNFSIENTTDGRRLLRFTTVVVNIGTGPLEVRGTRASSTDPWTAQQAIYDDAGGFRLVTTSATFVWGGDGHNHWHVKNLESFELRRLSDGGSVGISPKSGFCFGDNYQYKLGLPGAPQTKVYSGTGCAPKNPDALSLKMGVSVGWGDLYKYVLPDQYIDITSLPDGSYRLWATGDKSNQFLESNDANNTTWVDLGISGSTVTILKRAPNP
jgi:hypothetical protein